MSGTKKTQKTARFTEGSIRHHILRMTTSGGLGLLALFAVDLVDLFFISLLGEQALAAAVGFAGSIMFFTQSLSIGLSIAVGATVSKSLGSNQEGHARELASSGFFSVFIASMVVMVLVFVFREPLLALLGAEGDTLAFASGYLAIILPSFPFVAIGMAGGGVMRAQGDASGALWLTLSGAIVNAILDPILIFALGLGLSGAAWASVFSRLTIFAFCIYKVGRVYGLLQRPTFNALKRDVPELSAIALPSVLTNLATPVGIAYVTASMAHYGTAAVAGNAIISRLQMVAFVGLYALSSVVGPIAGQNWGANKPKRVNEVFVESVKFVVIYCLVVCGCLALATPALLKAFQASAQAAQLVQWFTYGLSLVFVFNGLTFVTNALFNNLGAPKAATVFNLLKATVFTVPFVWLGSQFFGAPGILIGQSIGSVFIAFAAWFWCRKLLNSMT